MKDVRKILNLARKFYNAKTGQVAMWHEPHPGNEVLKYVVDEAIELLKEQ